MLPVIEIPDEIQSYCSRFRDLFSSSEFSHFQKYYTGLFLVDNINISSINGCFVNGGNQSTMNRFLTDSKWDRQEFNQRRIKLLQDDPATRSSKKGNLILDDTMIEKHGPKIEYVGKLHDHSQGKYINNAHNLVTSLYADFSGRNWPYDFRFYLKKALLEEQGKVDQFKTKVELGVDLINEAINERIDFSFVLMDCWYLNPLMIKAIKEQKKHYIAEVRVNRLVWRHEQQRYIKLGAYLETDEFKDLKFTTVTVKNHRGKDTTYRYATGVYRLSKLGKQRLIFTQRWYEPKATEPEGRWSKIKILVTDAIDHNVTTLIKRYALRWDIEVFHQDEKQSFGLGQYRMRSIEAIKNHWCLVLAAYTLAASWRVEPTFMRKLSTKLTTIGETVRYVKERTLENFIRYLYQAFENQTPITNLCTIFKFIKPELAFF